VSKLVTPAQLVNDAYVFANMTQAAGSFITPAQALRFVNLAATEFYDVLIAARGHEYYIAEQTIPIVAGTSRYALPADHYETLSITLSWGTEQIEEVSDYSSVRDRWQFLNGLQWAQWADKGFRMRAGFIEFLPVPRGAVTATHQYIPAMLDLTIGGPTFDGVNGWERLISLKAASDMLTAAKQNSGDVDAKWARELQRIQEMADSRAAEHPNQIRDVYPEVGFGAFSRFLP
jgi:hypothetical protein